jgi:hydroxyacylglutathione hydrolase
VGFILKQVEIGPMQNFTYLIGDEASKEAMIVDPAWSVEKLRAIAEEDGFKLAGALVTHAHYDHTNAIEDLLKQIDIPVYVNRAEIPFAQSGNAIVGSLGRTAKAMNGGDKINLGETEIQLLHTPGHTPGSQCIRVGDHLITGDTLFIGGCGRSDLPGGDPATLFQSLRKIAQLPSHVEICPGHDYGDVYRRPLSEELKGNPYLGMSEEEFLGAVS